MVAFNEPDLTMHEKTTPQYITGNGFYQAKNNEIKQFYDDSVIFVTGATGFLGKVLIEKLLRSCPGIKVIYLLLRPKRGLCSEERHREYIKNSIFDRIRDKTPEMLNKLLFVAGDITQPHLGLNEFDLDKLYSSVDIVFHVAATVRFNESLLDAACLNTLGTQRVMDLCEKMMELKSVVHVSTAYSNPTLKNVGEVVYPPASPLNHEEFVKCINTMPKDFVGLISDQLQGTHPNTYTITKSMAEQIVAENNHKFPMCIVRPSIVTGALAEPYPGWVDNVFGITGIMMEIGRGTISSIMCEQKYIMDLVPVDIVANTMIASAWANAFNNGKNIRVYNCTSGQVNPVKWDEFGDMTQSWAIKNPTKYTMLYPGFTYRTNRFVHRIIEVFLHFLPALIFDLIMRCQGTKPIMMKIAKRFQRAADTGEFFAMHEWIFENSNLRQLIADVKAADDGAEFNCDMSTMSWNTYVEKYMLGIRKFVLKDGMESMAKAREKIVHLYWIKRVLQGVLLCLLSYLFMKIFYYFL